MPSAVVLMLALANGADAQPSDPPVEFGFGVGYARALHADLDYGALVYAGSLRHRVLDNLVVEAEGGYWRHAETRTFTVAEIRQTRSFWNAGGNLLFVGGNEWVQGFGGGGLGVFFKQSTFTQTTSSGTFETGRTLGPRLGAQVLGGADVAVARRLKIFGLYRFEMRSFEDPGGGAIYRIEGGVRIPIGL